MSRTLILLEWAAVGLAAYFLYREISGTTPVSSSSASTSTGPTTGTVVAPPAAIAIAGTSGANATGGLPPAIDDAIHAFFLPPTPAVSAPLPTPPAPTPSPFTPVSPTPAPSPSVPGPSAPVATAPVVFPVSADVSTPAPSMDEDPSAPVYGAVA